MTDKEKENMKRIVVDSPSDRYMDMSPTALAKVLGLATNTVRHKMDSLNGVDFCIQNGGGYHLYNHECLPILKAYIGKKADKGRKIDSEEFFRRICVELNQDPKQAFCKAYLYSQPAFRKYVMQTQLDAPIQQRLDCIRRLAAQLDVYPAEKSVAPFQVKSTLQVIASLDRIIYEMANLIPNGEKNQDASSVEVKTLAEQWCKKMISLRKELEEDLQILYEPSCEDALSALEHLLLEKLPAKALAIAKQMENISDGINQQQAFTKAMDKSGRENLIRQIQLAMAVNLENYLKAIFEMRVIPDIVIPKECSLPPLVASLVDESCQLLRYATENIEKRFLAMRLWAAVQACGAEAEIASEKIEAEARNEAEKVMKFTLNIGEDLRELWLVIRGIGGAEMVRTAMDTAIIARQMLPLKVAEKAVLEYLAELTEGKDPHIRPVKTMMLAAAVTIECYWRKCTDVYTDYIVARCEEYKKAMNET